MSRQEEREQEVKGKLAKLRKLRRMRAKVDKSIGELKERYGKLTIRMVEVKAEIRLLGGKVPVGSEYNEARLLWHLRDGRKVNEQRP